MTAPGRYGYAKVGLRGSTKEGNHVGNYHGRVPLGEGRA